MNAVPTGLTAIVALALAILPGAACVFAFGSRAGSFGTGLPDRVIRFFAVSAVLHAFLAGYTYYIYKDYVLTAKIQRGEISAWNIEAFALGYILFPYLVGFVVGEAVRRNWLHIRRLMSGSPEPRAWDFVFSRRPYGAVRLKLKSGVYVAGIFGTAPDGRRSHASGYPEPGDLYLSQTLEIDPTTGHFVHRQGQPVVHETRGILVRWDEIEIAEFFEKKG